MKLEHSPIVYFVNRCSAEKDWLCFLHAAFVDHRMFRQQVEHFQGSFNILTLDIVGHGESSQTQKGDGIDQMAHWMQEILTAECIEKIHLVGVSLGAVLAQDFANHYPQRVASIACFGGYDINNFDVKMQQGNTAAQMGMMLKAFFSIKWFAEANKKISAYTKQAQDEFYEMNIQFQKKSFMYLAGLNGLVNKFPPTPRTYPLLIGCGEHDIPMEHKAVEMWKATEPECQMVVFQNAGHCVNMDVPQYFNDVMEDFWTRNPSV